MAIAMLDPGPDGSYPYNPRTPNGYLDTDRALVGLWKARISRGHSVLIGVTNLTEGRPITTSFRSAQPAFLHPSPEPPSWTRSSTAARGTTSSTPTAPVRIRRDLETGEGWRVNP